MIYEKVACPGVVLRLRPPCASSVTLPLCNDWPAHGAPRFLFVAYMINTSMGYQKGPAEYFLARMTTGEVFKDNFLSSRDNFCKHSVSSKLRLWSTLILQDM